MSGFTSTITKNWAVIREAPEAFFALVVVAFVICWLIVRHLKANQIGNLESRLSLRDDEIADYKRKLEGASPDEAAARIATLEATVEKLGPRKLSLAQRQAMLPFLQPYGGCDIGIIVDATSADVAHFKTGLVGAFQEAGWNVVTSMAMGGSDHAKSGLALMVPDLELLTGAQQAVANALEAAGLEFERSIFRPLPTMAGGTPRVAELFVTTRLDS